MSVVSQVILWWVAAIAIVRTIRTLVGAVWLSRQRSRPSTGSEPFVLLLPAFREQSLARETIQHFRSLDYPRDSYRVLIITSERERIERDSLRGSLDRYAEDLWTASTSRSVNSLLTGHLPRNQVSELLASRPNMSWEIFVDQVHREFAEAGTTTEIVANLIGADTLIRCVEAPANWLRKAGQLRYAIDRLESTLGDWPDLLHCRYVGVYDFDARPDAGALAAARNASVDGAPILQQPGLTVPRERVGAATKERLFSVVDGQMHARFGLRQELTSLLIDRVLERFPYRLARLLRSSIHTVGNGLFLDRFSLANLGGIPEVVDDLAIGWRAAARGNSIRMIQSPVFYDAYESLPQSIQSRKFIATGYLRAVEDIRTESGQVEPYRGQLLRIYARLAQWAIGPYLRVAVLMVAATVLPRLTFAVVALTYLCYLLDMLVVRLVWRRWQPISCPAWLNGAALALGPLGLLWYGAGPLWASLRWLLGERSIAVAKTER